MKSFNEYAIERTLAEGTFRFTPEETKFLDSDIAQATYIKTESIPNPILQSLFAKGQLRDAKNGPFGHYVQLSGEAARYVNQIKMSKAIFGR